jgi:hypothetical protein
LLPSPSRLGKPPGKLESTPISSCMIFPSPQCELTFFLSLPNCICICIRRTARHSARAEGAAEVDRRASTCFEGHIQGNCVCSLLVDEQQLLQPLPAKFEHHLRSLTFPTNPYLPSFQKYLLHRYGQVDCPVLELCYYEQYQTYPETLGPASFDSDKLQFTTNRHKPQRWGRHLITILLSSDHGPATVMVVQALATRATPISSSQAERLLFILVSPSQFLPHCPSSLSNGLPRPSPMRTWFAVLDGSHHNG